MIFRIPAFIVLFFLLLGPASASQSKSDPVFKQINSIVNTLSAITGLTEEHAVPVGRISQSQLRKFLAHRVKTTLKAKEVYADELSLKMFGLVPADFDLRKSTVDLLTEQAAAFYDYQEKKLMMLDAASFSSEELTLSHELAHALADQHFNLSKFVEDTSENDDENLAHAAVVEGQASWLMLAYQMRQQGIDAPPTQDVLSSVENSAEVSESGFPVLQHSPLYIQQSLMFPYYSSSGEIRSTRSRRRKSHRCTYFTETYSANRQTKVTPARLPNSPRNSITASTCLWKMRPVIR